MNKLAHWLATVVRDQVQRAIQAYQDTNIEYRLIFRGPPLELLEPAFDELALSGGILIQENSAPVRATLPVLLQYPPELLPESNPKIGESGKCDCNHLLDVRNSHSNPSFVTLVPPGLHNNLSIESTTDEFGLSSATSTGHASFEQWWEDSFVQRVVTEGLKTAGIEQSQYDDAKALIRSAASSVDEVDPYKSGHHAAWRLLSRVYSIQNSPHGLTAEQALQLACGFPATVSNKNSSKTQTNILKKISDELSDGFKTGIDRLAQDAEQEVKQALQDFLNHVQSHCDIPTAFERAAEAFYLPSADYELIAPPSWWTTLTTEQWTTLLTAEDEETPGEITIQCTNGIVPMKKGMPVVVRDLVELTISTSESHQQQEHILRGGSYRKEGTPLTANSDGLIPITDPAPPAHMAPLTYKASTDGCKPASIRVISLATWRPGILVTSRHATKLSPPKKPRKKSASLDLETSLSVPGSGRYELCLHMAPKACVTKVEGLTDDATEVEAKKKEIKPKHVGDAEYLVEVEADGKYQLDVTFTLPDEKASSTCRVYLTCEETKEEGCRSEFERLIKLNRRHLERFDTKTVVHLDRNSRASSLQTWMLDDIANSFMPLVIGDDYASHWAPPAWGESHGPILSSGRFLHDPRPHPSRFQPPDGFLEAREKIASYIRTSGDGHSGLIESSPLGAWLSNDTEFHTLVEDYLDLFTLWLSTEPSIACWVDTAIVCSLAADGRSLDRVPDAILLSPLHPLRLAWHCLAQNVLWSEVEGTSNYPCPAASILDPDCVPDLMTLILQAPDGEDCLSFLSVECSSDYWSVLWNGSRLSQIVERVQRAPFDGSFGLTVGGISSGFSTAQVSRALDDVTDLLAAKPIVSLAVSSAGGTTDACNEGLTNWCTKRFGNGDQREAHQSTGGRILEVFDTRDTGTPDQATIANLSEDTNNHVRWYTEQPTGAKPDLGIIAQLNSAQPEAKDVGMLSPMGIGGLIRHRVRRQLQASFLSESRQGLQMPPSGEAFADKIVGCMLKLEKLRDGKIGLQFAPNVHAVSSMLEDNSADFVAVSSSAIDPACFLGGWIQGTYLWDYDLPSYSHRAGDTSGYYLLSQVRKADRDAMRRVLRPLPGCEKLESDKLDDRKIEQILLEVARRGIPTVRGLSGDDTGATGDLGLFLAVRLLQDQFRVTDNLDSLLPVIEGTEDDTTIAVIVPVDPFRGYLSDLARSLGKENKEITLSRPDLLVIGIHASNDKVHLRLTPVEVKCRQGSVFSSNEANDALSQAKALSTLFLCIEERADKSMVWRLAYQHLLLSMIGFGLRVYSQHQAADGQAARWAGYHERIAATILSPAPSISIDKTGRLIVVDGSDKSDALDRDSDGFLETIVISSRDAGRIITDDDTQAFYDAVRDKVGDWALLPSQLAESSNVTPQMEDIPPQSSPASLNPLAAEVDNLPENNSPASDSEQSPSATTSPTAQGSGIILSVGKTIDGFEHRSLSLNISDTRLNQLNLGVVGDLGTGKTQFLKSLIFQISRAHKVNRGIPPRFLIFDYKRDYSTPDFVAATGARVVKPQHLPLNLFDTTGMGESSAPWLDRFRFFTDVLDKIFSGIGPVQRDKLKGAVRNAYETAGAAGRQPSIYDIHAEYRELLSGKSDSPMAIIDDLVDMEVFTKNPEETIPFNEFLDGVVVISLDSMGQDDRSKNMLVAIMLNMFYENMLRTPKRPFLGSDPQLRAIDSYLLVDEADNIMRYEFDVLRKLLLQGREFGTGVILASQYLRHFKAGATDYREPLLTWFIHKVPNVTPAELGVLGFTSELGELSERVKTLPNHECLYKSFDVSGEVIRGLPFFELMTKS